MCVHVCVRSVCAFAIIDHACDRIGPKQGPKNTCYYTEARAL